MYQVLARKYRPHSFQEMVGQEHVLRALINALDQQRLHHAYLFTGTRGVGKTTLARIIAKCLNCEKGVSSVPCGECTTCQEIDHGRYIDLLEIDAASRTKVEDTRDLLDNVQYAPARGRYKVYLIDEVHMLSGHSFNALLKTLEEPPPHVKFLFATTDPQRLPVTVLSRCLQFNLKRLNNEEITKQLAFILTQEKIPFEANALNLLAQAADGSARDALSLLDQAIGYGNGQVNNADVKTMLGSIDQTHILQLIDALADNNAASIFAIIQQLSEQAVDFNQALESLLSLLHRIAVAQAVPDLLTANSEENTAILALAKKLGKEEVQLYYQIGLIGRRDLPLAPAQRSGFEMVLLRMLAFQLPGTASPPKTATPALAKMATALQPAPEQSASPAASSAGSSQWPDIVKKLNLTGIAQALAEHCSLQKIADNRVFLLLDPSQAALRNPRQETRLAEALSTYFGKPTSLQINMGNANLATPARMATEKHSDQLQAAAKALENDVKVQSILKTFDATIQPGTIKINPQEQPI